MLDTKGAVKIFGPEVYSLRGKTVGRQGQNVPHFDSIQVDPNILNEYDIDSLCVGNFYVNGNIFFHTITKTVTAVQNRSKPVLLNELSTVLNIYDSTHYVITDVHADHDFQCVREKIRPIKLDVCNPDDHVHDAKQSIMIITERVRCTMHSFPFKQIPRVMVRVVVEKAVTDLN